jgi:hypothetical protein
MNEEERERQRVAKLRAAQIKTRDPGPSKIPHYDWSNQRPRKRTPILKEIFGVFPTRIRGLAIGLLLGIVAAIAIQFAAPEFAVCGIIAMIVFGIAGWVLGMVIQSQHDW